SGDRAFRLVLAVLAGQTLWLLVFRAEFVVHDYRTYWFLFPIAFFLADGVRALTDALGASALRSMRWAPAALLLINNSGSAAFEILPKSRARAGGVDMAKGYRPRHAEMMAARAAGSLAAGEARV